MNRIMIIAAVVLGFVAFAELFVTILKKILGLLAGSDEIITLHPPKLPLLYMNKEVT